MSTTEERTPDMQALEELYAWAESEDAKQRAGLPSEWDQSTWGRVETASCGSACCIAGRQVQLDGGKFIPVRLGPNATQALMPGGRTVFIEDYSAKRLGLSEERAEALFGSDNTLSDLRTIIDRIAEGDDFFFGYDRDED